MLSEFRFIHSLHTITKCCTKCINPVLSLFISTPNLVKKTAHTNSNDYLVKKKDLNIFFFLNSGIQK